MKFQFIKELTLIIDFLIKSAVLGLIIWQAKLYDDLHKITRAVRKKQEEIDSVESKVMARTANGPVTASQQAKQIEMEKEPLRRELARLKDEREFIKDKLLFTNK